VSAFKSVFPSRSAQTKSSPLLKNRKAALGRRFASAASLCGREQGFGPAQGLRFRVELDTPFQLQLFNGFWSEIRLGFVPAGALGVASESRPAAASGLSRREHR